MNIDKVLEEYSGVSIAIVGDNKNYLKSYVENLVYKITNNDIQRYYIVDQENIKIDDIRRIQDFLSFSVESGKKIVVLFNAEKMLPGAENSILKTLEEPPKYALIILVTTSWNSLYPTIRSRLQKFVLNFPKDKIKELEEFIQKKLYLEFPEEFEKIKNKDFVEEKITEQLNVNTYYTFYIKVKEALKDSKTLNMLVMELLEVKNFKILKAIAKVALWICEEYSLDYTIAREFSRIASSKVSNYNYELTYYYILLSLKDAIKKNKV
ncbi:MULTISPECIES: DNA polymerase III subunit delta' [unclassified Thermosipho (in: thermotogales)]|uniref:DNA polymerase III subunit delta' n=1 Tax=unclassified Thermosipho (in: thermotogales) TaxID=2676525 RepID=UPI000984DE5B|nr:DNA polymerase III subunit delta' [Thermosipho sp. 1223]MBT1248685.1 DNA polymerase III subunit gamma/tau [Thermosipho sp. 1244]OOC47578.1 DNA polymerase III subunit gamma/tau [Thermosipho sp. 1223]